MRRTAMIAFVALVLPNGACTEKRDTKPTPQPDATASKPPPPVKKAPPAGPPVREATRGEIEGTIRQLEVWVKKGASDPRNPWAMAHGLVAFGKDLKATDGRLAIDVIVSDFARLESVAGKKVWGFDEITKDKIPVEPHNDLMLKAIVQAGVPLDRKFKIKGKKVSLQKLVDDAAWAFTVPNTQKQWRDFAWSMGMFLTAYGPEGTLKTQKGEVPLKGLVRKSIQQLEDEQAFLNAAHTENTPHKLVKKRQGIFAHTCGGLHFVQAGFQGAAVSEREAKLRATKQLELVDFRWDAERRLYRQTIRAQPRYKFLLHIQELKFHGHVLETNALAVENGLVTPDAKRIKLMREVAADLIDAVAELKPLYETQDQLQKSSPQQYYDLIGDGCHAIRGLKLGKEPFFAKAGAKQ